MDSTTDWLMVVITAIYVIATIVICVFNGKSAKAAREQTETAKKQIEEMLRQYNASNRPIVTVRFDVIRGGLLCFVLENIGPKAAINVNIHINDAFIRNLPMEYDRNNLSKLNEAHFMLASQQKQYIMFGSQANVKQIAQEAAVIDVTYNIDYCEHVKIDIIQYGSMLSYSSELDEIGNHLRRIENENKAYHSRLNRTIERKASTCVFHIEGDSIKYQVYREVCFNPGITAEELTVKMKHSKEEIISALQELSDVNRLIYYDMISDDDNTAKWYRRT